MKTLTSGIMVWPVVAMLLVCAGVGVSSQKNSSTENVNITETVMEVEKILDNYPELPRIDRSEIMSILENITVEDSARLKDELTGLLEEEKLKMKKETGAKNKTEPGRSVMVVLPFKPEDQDESLEELYTRSPIVRMEKEKVAVHTSTTTMTPKEAIGVTPPPGFSIVEKEDDKFSPPLRVIGFRYETTPGAGHTDNTPPTYTNFQNPEQVTKAFTTQQFQPSHGWNHQGFDATPVSTTTTENPQFTWKSDFSTAATDSKFFNEPASMDNFSLEDVMMDNMPEEQPAFMGPTLRNWVDDSSTSTQPITEKIISTSEKVTTSSSTTTTTTEKIYTTAKPVKRKNKPKTKAPEKLTTTTVSPAKASDQKQLEAVLDTLPPHLRQMLSNLGVNKEIALETSETGLATPPDLPPISPAVNSNIDASSYMAFKPIPTKKHRTVSEDMQEFLASFGLLDGLRQQKSAVEEETTTKKFDDKYLEGAPQINTDILDDSMKETLETLGLYQPLVSQESTNKKSNKKKHVFNPKEHTGVQSDEEMKKLNALLSTIRKLASLNDSEPVTPEFQQEIIRQVKELDNITISYKTSAAINEEIHKIMARNKGKFKIPIVMKESSSINTLQSGLDPQFFEEIQLKNEVKRQENGTSDSEMSSSTEGSTSTTEEPTNSAGLEDAFGGGDTAPQDANPADSLPPKRPNGLYLLLDWNTFFEVGTEDDARRVNIRFQPKIGDGRNFLPVAIP